MPNEGDVALAKLAVEAGYLPRQLASQYWHQCQTPGAPRLVELLLRDGRLTTPQVDHLRTLYFQQYGGGPATGTLPQPEPHKTMLPTGDGAESHFLTAEEAWEEALELDTEMARVLLNKRMVERLQLRECRDIQLAQHMRLGDILVQRGYVDQDTVEATLQLVQDAPIALSSTREPQPPSLPRPQAPAPPLSPSGQLYVAPQPPQGLFPPARPHEDPAAAMRLTQELSPEEIVGASPVFADGGGRRPLFESEPSPPPLPSSGRVKPGQEESGEPGPPPLMNQDEAPTVVGAKAIRRRAAEDEPTMPNMDLSIDELNPFAGFGGGAGAARERSDDSLDIIMEPSQPWGGGAAPGDLLADRAHAATQTDEPSAGSRPKGKQPMLPMHSVDELDAFSNLFDQNESGGLGDSRAVTIEKDMSDVASAEAQGAWSDAAEAWGPGPGFDGQQAPDSGASDGSFGEAFDDAFGGASGGASGGAYDSEETGGAGYVNFSNLPVDEKLINSEDVPPRAPVGASAFPDEGSEHLPAPDRPRAVVGAVPPKKKGGLLGTLIRGVLILAALGGVGVGAYFGFSQYLAQQETAPDAPGESPEVSPPDDSAPQPEEPSGQ